MEDLVRLLKALGDPTRLKLVRILADGELCVCELAAVLPCGQSAVSQHLAKLKAAGVVRERRDGQWTHYRLARPDDLAHDVAVALDRFLRTPLDAQPALADEALRLRSLDRGRTCAPPAAPAAVGRPAARTPARA